MKRPSVLLPSEVLAMMEREANRCYPDESGGVLLGYSDADDPDQIQVLLQIGPGPGAVHEPARFEPDSEWQEKRIAEEYEDSGRVATYLGDWHSHPGGSSRPSSLDRSTARSIARHRAARSPRPLILILFGEPDAWWAVAYRHQLWHLRRAELATEAELTGERSGSAVSIGDFDG